jgi:hypothetical protein
MKSNTQKLSMEERDELLTGLRKRFEKNTVRHKGVKWDDVEAKLENAQAKLFTLSEMERTGGEPDVVGFDKKSNEYIFFDCSPESPKGRRSLCYDGAAWDSRKEHKPRSAAVDDAAEIGANF